MKTSFELADGYLNGEFELTVGDINRICRALVRAEEEISNLKLELRGERIWRRDCHYE